MTALHPLPVRIAARVFGLAVRLLPGRLRSAFEADIRQAFLDDALDGYRYGGAWRLIRVTSTALADAVFDGQARRSSPRGSWMTTLTQDLRYGLRTLRRQRGFTVAAILMLSLGIGANTAIFTLLNAAILRPLPYAEPDRLMRVWGARVDLGEYDNQVNPNDAADWDRGSDAIEMLGVFTTTTQPLNSSGDPAMVPVAFVSSGYFATLRISPAMGRLFGPEHDQPGRETEIVVTDGFWRRALGGDPKVLGSTIRLAEVPCTIVGVLGPGFASPGIRAGAEPQVWRPLVVAPDNRGGHFARAIARLGPGATIQEAQAQVDAVAERLSQQYPSTNLGQRGRLEPLQAAIAGDTRTAILLLMAAVSVVLFIACANVSNLLLARATIREREFAVRGALGASRGRIVRQLLAEGFMLAAIAGVLGVGVGILALKALPAWVADEWPTVMAITLDGRALVFTLAMSFATVLLFGLVPALAASRYDLRRTLVAGAPGGGGGARGFHSALVLVEAALATVLLVGATFLIESLVRLQRVDPGFATAETLTFRITLPRTRYSQPESRNAFLQRLADEIAARPGVHAAGGVNTFPLSGRNSCDSFGLADRPAPPDGQEPCAEVRVATPGYFRAIGIPLVSGRQLLSTDTPKSMPVAVISDAMARRYWPGGNAVGQRLKWGSVASKGPWLTIVGVIGNVKHFGLDEAAPDEVYMPLEQSSATSFTFAVRGAGDQSLRREEIRRLVRGMDAALPVAELFTTQELVERSVALPRFRTELLSIFALLAVLLATAGVYSVMASQVAQRRREIGIRLALGATPREVKRMVVTRGLRPVAVGCVLGLLAANALMRLAQEILFGVTPGHPRAYAVASALLCLTALIACYLPARRAASFDPIASIRAD